MGSFISPEDLAPFADIDAARAAAMIEDAEAMALVAAPCLSALAVDDPKRSVVKAVLRQALLRWDQSGAGALSQRSESTGAFSVSETYDTRQSRRALFWPSELTELQNLCGTSERKAFSIDLAPSAGLSGHSPYCSLVFGATYCSCGADINNDEMPLYEGGILDTSSPAVTP